MIEIEQQEKRLPDSKFPPARSHGTHSFQQRGEVSLKPHQVNRLAELRQMVIDAPGRTELRQELTARTALLVDLGFAYLMEQVEAGEDIWQGGIIRRLATYIGESRRLLDSFDDNAPRGDAVTLIQEAMIKGKGNNERSS